MIRDLQPGETAFEENYYLDVSKKVGRSLPITFITNPSLQVEQLGTVVANSGIRN